MGTDPDLVIPNKHLSVAEGAVVPWQSQAQQYYQVQFERTAPRHGFRLDVPIRDLTREEYDLLWNGARDVIGINEFFRDIESQTYKVQYRVMLARYRGYALCPDCQGKRLRPEALYVKLKGADFGDLADLAIEALQAWFEAQSFSEYEVAVAGRILYEIRSRLKYLLEVGLGYLSLSRRADSLSGGETQRIHLANSLGSTLTGSLYILDEPTIGLHPRDNHRLIDTLLSLRNLGNTVILVEHDEAVMRRSDYLVDLGPHAGEHGGHLVFGGTPAAIEQYPDSLTGQYLSGQSAVALPAERRTPEHFIRLNGAAENNLRNLDVQVPTGCLTVLTGVSGSGKTSLTRRILHPALARQLEIQTERPGPYRALELPREVPIRHTEMVDQKSIGRTLRSNPVTYTNAFDPIRELFAQQPKARENRLKPMHFSFNVPGGRCDTCEGEGFVTIEMQFLPDIKLTCESCKGRRFKEFVLAVEYKGQSIYDVLQMTISEAIAFFEDQPKIADRLRQLDEVGLGYIRLGQNTSSLSGGEAQRLKLASFLNRKKEHHTVYFFDEPTTGLHFHDISILMQALNRLVDQGNTVVIIEHNLEVIKCADWLIDLGPDGGARGGQLLYQGAPEGLPAVEASHTGYYLKEKLARSAAGS
jgi:excinuclease ABC subunit A